METLIFDNCHVSIYPETGYTRTFFEDETFAPCLPTPSPLNIYLGKNLGYGDNLRAMIIHHEILLTFLAESKGLDFSPALWSIAHDLGENTWEEEALVLSFQKYLNTREVEPPVENFLKETDLKLKKIKEEALKLIGDFE
jgi:hypothetical protein